MSRYDKIMNLIDLFEPRTIAETGTWNGRNAVRMLRSAGKYHNNTQYIGYDLFEGATAETDTEEFNVKPHNNCDDVLAFIKHECEKADVTLIKGNTRDTLKPLIVDFAFIDGGHSLETIQHDYEMLKKSSIVVFDDYYTPDAQGRMPDISKIGCNMIVEKLPHTVIRTEDPVISGGFVNLAVVFGV
jgi:predicted O-methyltransferase YrrM